MALFLRHLIKNDWMHMTTSYVGTCRAHTLPRLAGRTGTGEFGPGWLGMVGLAGKSWPGTGAEFNTVVYFSKSVEQGHIRSTSNV